MIYLINFIIFLNNTLDGFINYYLCYNKLTINVICNLFKFFESYYYITAAS